MNITGIVFNTKFEVTQSQRQSVTQCKVMKINGQTPLFYFRWCRAATTHLQLVETRPLIFWVGQFFMIWLYVQLQRYVFHWDWPSDVSRNSLYLIMCNLARAYYWHSIQISLIISVFFFAQQHGYPTGGTTKTLINRQIIRTFLHFNSTSSIWRMNLWGIGIQNTLIYAYWHDACICHNKGVSFTPVTHKRTQLPLFLLWFKKFAWMIIAHYEINKGLIF